jgi:nucleoside-diphosphate-sugar epimerase
MVTLVTGANGFIGQRVVQALRQSGDYVRAAVRQQLRDDALSANEVVVTGSIDGTTDWRTALRDVEAVIHLAGRAHVIRDSAMDPLAEYRRVNVAGTGQLLRQSVQSRVKRFVLISSIKVNGERTASAPFTSADVPAPYGPYAVSKWEAEQTLRTLGGDSIEQVVVRPTLVYGPGVKGNLKQLIVLVNRGVPLPVGGVSNRRSMIDVKNLADLIVVCAKHPAASGETVLGADVTVSTPDLIKVIAAAMERTPIIIPIPPPLIRVLGSIPGLRSRVARLTESLEVDSASLKRLGWVGGRSFNDAVAEMVHAQLRQSSGHA